MSDTLRDLPELFETDLGESISSRTLNMNTFRELGPPDLCHIIKTNIKPAIKEVGSYHFVLGVEASNSASLAAYLNSLSYYIDDPQGWFGKNPQWRIRSGVYCCYNSFSRVDVRVEVKIPGGVEAYMVNNKAEKLPLTDEAWAETYLSAALRSIAYSDDLNYKVPGMRMLNIVPDLEAENRLLSTAQLLFHKGWQLGTDPTTQFATHVNNHLTDILIKYFDQTNHFQAGINFFTKLADKDPEMNSLLSECYLKTDQELQSVQILCDGLKANPSSFNMLCQQATFLLQKNRYDLALALAKKAVNAAPSEFRTWVTLSEIYIELKDYKAALLTLNSCPMFSYTERDVPRMPPPLRVSFPEKHESILAFGMVEPELKQDDATTSALFRLPGNALKGTFASAYNMLTLIASKVGWDDLLKFRSAAFVMEEEYRIQKSKEEHSSTSATTPQAYNNQPSPNMTTFDGSNLDSQNQDNDDIPAEYRPEHQDTQNEPKKTEVETQNPQNGVSEEKKDENEPELEAKTETESSKPQSEEVNSTEEDGVNVEKVEDSATDKEGADKSEKADNGEISEEQAAELLADVSLEDEPSKSENDKEIAKDEAVSEENKDDGFESVAIETEPAAPAESSTNQAVMEEINEEDIQDLSSEKPQDKQEPETEEVKEPTPKSSPPPTVAQPEAANKEEPSSKNEQKEKKQVKIQPLNLNSTNSNNSQPFGNKRLCERWLDNLFMVLYEDLRAFTAWRAEMSGTRSQRLVYRYTGSEWEALGDLCLRLHRLEEARDAYTNCVHHKFSPRSWAYLLEVHTKENDLQLAIGALIRVAMYFETNYSECMVPSPVTNSFKTLIKLHGLSKINNLISSLSLAPEVRNVIVNYLNWCKKFEMEGSLV